MIIDPGFPDHWKVCELNRLSGTERATSWMIRLWGEVQRRRSQHFSSDLQVARVAGFGGDPQTFIGWLEQLHWIEKNGSGYVVTKWEEYNRSLLASWENAKKGGRPKKPVENRQKTDGFSTENRQKTEKSRLEKIREENHARVQDEGYGEKGRNEESFRLIASGEASQTAHRKVSRNKSPMMSNAVIKELETNPAYKGIDVITEAFKFKTWCEKNQKTQTVRRFVNWLNRV